MGGAGETCPMCAVCVNRYVKERRVSGEYV